MLRGRNFGTHRVAKLLQCGGLCRNLGDVSVEKTGLACRITFDGKSTKKMTADHNGFTGATLKCARAEMSGTTGIGSVRRESIHNGNTAVLDLFKAGDVFTPSSFLVQRWIQRSPQGQCVSTASIRRSELDKRVVQIIPDSLLAAMWLQLAQAVAGNRQHRSLQGLPPMVRKLSTEEDGFRISRVFCSDPCESKDYRMRKESRFA